MCVGGAFLNLISTAYVYYEDYYWHECQPFSLFRKEQETFYTLNSKQMSNSSCLVCLDVIDVYAE